MKHKGERNIPDFSHKPKTPHGVAPDKNAARPATPKRAPQGKPQSTSVKSGRRGS